MRSGQGTEVQLVAHKTGSAKNSSLRQGSARRKEEIGVKETRPDDGTVSILPAK